MVFQLIAPVSSQPTPKRESCTSLDGLPDECLFEILRRLAGKQDRGAAACVSRRWLMLLSTIRSCDIVSSSAPVAAPEPTTTAAGCRLPDLNEDPATVQEDDVPSVPELARCLEGKDATDARLAAAAITAGAQLTKLSVRSSAAVACPLTDAGLRAVARCCPSLRALAVWDAPFIGDEGLAEVAEGCPLLEKLDLSHCPMVSDKGIAAVAERCPNLKCVSLESCPRVGDAGLAALGRGCFKLDSVNVSGCPLVGDQGVCSLVSSTRVSSSLTKLKLENLGITDVSLGALGYYGREVASLVLGGLQKVGEKGFWVMGNAGGMRKVTSFSVSGCPGLTDLGLEAVVKSSAGMRQLSLRKCSGLSDRGLKSAAGAVSYLEGLRLEDCIGVTLPGVLGALEKCCRIKTLYVSKCSGIKETNINSSSNNNVSSAMAGTLSCSLQVLSLRNCRGLNNACMAALGRFCPRLQHLDLRGLPDVTDAGVLKLLEHCTPGSSGGLVKAVLSGCPGITDAAVSSICSTHGSTLGALNLSGCIGVSDVSLFAAAQSCTALGELDVSGTAVSDNGIMALASPSANAKRLGGLHTLSLARCQKISAGCLSFLAGLGESLIGLNLLNCNMISPTAAGVLAERMWWCDILY